MQLQHSRFMLAFDKKPIVAKFPYQHGDGDSLVFFISIPQAGFHQLKESHSSPERKCVFQFLSLCVCVCVCCMSDYHKGYGTRELVSLVPDSDQSNAS